MHRKNPRKGRPRVRWRRSRLGNRKNRETENGPLEKQVERRRHGRPPCSSSQAARKSKRLQKIGPRILSVRRRVGLPLPRKHAAICLEPRFRKATRRRRNER